MTTVSKLDCPPRYGTPRSHDRATLGPAVGEVAKRLGKPLMPWQQHVADVILEIDPDTGRLAYDEVGLTVPRQSGKSTFVLAKAIHRASATGFFGPRQRVVYTAQTRIKAREKWEEDFSADIAASRTFASKVTPHFGNGNEHLRFTNGSRFGIESSTEKAGHGGTLDECFIDEAFAQIDSRLEQAFRPAMITRANTQLCWVSTAGWLDASPYLLDKVTRGRDAADMGMRTGLAYFEWSAPDDADPLDPDVWAACMPALGHTITVEAIAAEARAMADNLRDFRRAYLNQWVHKDAPDAAVIDPEHWATLTDPTSAPTGPVVFALEVPRDRSTASIVVAGRRADGLGHVEVVEPDTSTGADRSGTYWVADRIAEMAARHKPTAIMLDGSGPAGDLDAALRARGVENIIALSLRQMGQACGGFVSAVNDGRLRHRGDPILDAAVAHATRRNVGDLWVWQRRNATTDLSSLIGATMALHGLDLAAVRKSPRSGVVI